MQLAAKVTIIGPTVSVKISLQLKLCFSRQPSRVLCFFVNSLYDLGVNRLQHVPQLTLTTVRVHSTKQSTSSRKSPTYGNKYVSSENSLDFSI